MFGRDTRSLLLNRKGDPMKWFPIAAALALPVIAQAQNCDPTQALVPYECVRIKARLSYIAGFTHACGQMDGEVSGTGRDLTCSRELSRIYGPGAWGVVPPTPPNLGGLLGVGAGGFGHQRDLSDLLERMQTQGLTFPSDGQSEGAAWGFMQTYEINPDLLTRGTPIDPSLFDSGLLRPLSTYLVPPSEDAGQRLHQMREASR